MKTTRLGKTRFAEIDIARGVGILLVVAGHALKQTGQSNTVFDILLSVIYSFHMPLFFILSGFVAVKSIEETDLISFTKKRACRLLIPYFFMSILYIPVKLYLSAYAVKPFTLGDSWKILIGESPDVEMWFLFVLFWISVLTALLVRKERLKLFLSLSLLLSLVMYGAGWDIRILKYWFFYLLGLTLRLHYAKLRFRLNQKGILSLAGILFIAANVGLYWGSASGIRLLSYINIEILPLLSAVSGSLLVLALSWRLSLGEGQAKKFFGLLGDYSMDVYITSDPLNTITRLILWNKMAVNYISVTVICFILGLLIPIPLSRYIIRKVRIFRKLILGLD